MRDIPVVDPVDTPKFMGSWYVIAHIPPFLTNDAHNAVEHYELEDDGKVAVTYSYNKGALDGEQKVMRPTGFPQSGDKDGEWGMRFVWPLKSDYRIAYLDDSYKHTIIARNKRDYVWIMARAPTIDDALYQRLVDLVSGMGYAIENLRQVPQLPPSQRDANSTNPASGR